MNAVQKFLAESRQNKLFSRRAKRGQARPPHIAAAPKTLRMLKLAALFLFATEKGGVSAVELKRQLGVTYKCAWRMARRIRGIVAAQRGGPEVVAARSSARVRQEEPI